MRAGSGIVIEPLANHDRSLFACGQSELDDWFKKRASQDERRNFARVFVAVDKQGRIAGFYSLSTFTLSLDEIPESLVRKVPRYQAIPAALIGRLARDEHWHGQGIGELLLADAVRRILGAARSMAVFAIVVEAKNEAAESFYTSFGFEPFPSRPNRLFMLASTALAALTRE